ncbi:hypothetical protein F5Y04DRAFT_280723 [Hypomontagnella monticulosa]|nr:hypothetical protein F5Y04DRAFT_280723 [Hypomontagnella monticulosa]
MATLWPASILWEGKISEPHRTANFMMSWVLTIITTATGVVFATVWAQDHSSPNLVSEQLFKFSIDFGVLALVPIFFLAMSRPSKAAMEFDAGIVKTVVVLFIAQVACLVSGGIIYRPLELSFWMSIHLIVLLVGLLCFYIIIGVRIHKTYNIKDDMAGTGKDKDHFTINGIRNIILTVSPPPPPTPPSPSPKRIKLSRRPIESNGISVDVEGEG